MVIPYSDCLRGCWIPPYIRSYLEELFFLSSFFLPDVLPNFELITAGPGGEQAFVPDSKPRHSQKYIVHGVARLANALQGSIVAVKSIRAVPRLELDESPHICPLIARPSRGSKYERIHSRIARAPCCLSVESLLNKLGYKCSSRGGEHHNLLTKV
jgi:hypothetical protein